MSKIGLLRVIISWPCMSGKRLPVIESLDSHVVLGSFLDARGYIVVRRRRQIVFVILKSSVLGNTV